MILAVNLGNTNLRAAVGHKKPEACAAIPITELNCADDFARFIGRQFGMELWERLEGTVISSVVPDKTPAVTKAVISMTGKPPQRIGAKGCAGLDWSGYGGQPGEDRLACCIGALHKYAPPLVLIDFGTATTLGVVDGGGRFIGGAILAGVRIGLRALSEHTAQLPDIALGAETPVIGRNTAENLSSGAVIGAACAVGGYIRRIEAELGCAVTAVATGGHAPFVLPHCDFESAHEPDILLEGLFSLYLGRNHYE